MHTKALAKLGVFGVPSGLPTDAFGQNDNTNTKQSSLLELSESLVL